MLFWQPFFRINPETFDAIDMDFTISKSFVTIHSNMFISLQNWRTVALESIGVGLAYFRQRNLGH